MDEERDPMQAHVYDAGITGTTPDERTWATLMHVAGVATYPVLGPFAPLVPLVMWLMKRETSGYIDDHGREALNFSISLLIWSLLFALFVIVTIGIGGILVAPATVIGVIFVVIWVVKGSMAANRGEYYRYPMCFRLVCS